MNGDWGLGPIPKVFKFVFYFKYKYQKLYNYLF